MYKSNDQLLYFLYDQMNVAIAHSMKNEISMDTFTIVAASFRLYPYTIAYLQHITQYVTPIFAISSVNQRNLRRVLLIGQHACMIKMLFISLDTLRQLYKIHIMGV